MFATKRPTKRMRILGPWDLNLANIVPEIDVNAARQANDLRLKSRFEDIFEKYGKDFSSVGDEIDLATGRIIIDNGHIEKMRNEQDLGAQKWRYEFDPLGETEATTDRLDKSPNFPTINHSRQNKEPTEVEEVHPRNVISFGEGSHSICSRNSGLRSRNGSPFENGVSPRNGFLHRTSSYLSRERVRTSSQSVEPLWQTSEIDNRLFGSFPAPALTPIFPRNRSVSPPNSGSLWALPQTGRPKLSRTKGRKPLGARKIRSLKRSKSSDCISHSDSDDPLQNAFRSVSTPSKTRTPAKATIAASTLCTNKSSTIIREPTKKSDSSYPSPSYPLQKSELHDHKPEDEMPQSSPQNHDQQKLGILTESPSFQVNDSIENSVESESSTNPENDISLYEPDSISKIPETSKPAKLSTATEPLTPSEIRIILTLRVVQKRPWKEVYRSIPERTSGQLRHWYYVRSVDIKRCRPPEISWTEEVKDALESFKLQSEVSWEDLEAALKGQTRNELQCEWAKICLGEAWEDWKSSYCPPTQQQEWQFKTPTRLPKRTLVIKSPSLVKLLQPARTVSRRPAPLTPFSAPAKQVEQSDESDDSDDPLSEAFDTAWSGAGLSSIQVDTPPKMRTPQKRQSLIKIAASPYKRRTPKEQFDV
ncbi:hypothetical protein PAAG_04805 [Paracoccidioides lutzii Pb01]|uniref:Myb-like domain-containing protein n=1 Tax=Paracoccidioides lutzii (strain ATCC MYA-826 / Pb01) TaxID=502779 RepID=C1H1L9_PARBA|nr:hypothetical protein PAAG_04805 [Paracoccidioides lutzii Pb01]EEH33756.2 hypothetical protein PAAG_04805 [Paracoccidioides lutzii Pb01]